MKELMECHGSSAKASFGAVQAKNRLTREGQEKKNILDGVAGAGDPKKGREITNTLKNRFCKDTGLPINLYKEPYFRNRLELFNNQYGSLQSYGEFLGYLESFKDESAFFEECTRVMGEAIAYMEQSEGLSRFKQEDMNKYAVTNTGLPKTDIYKQTNDKRVFVSIDMVKANYSALRHYDKGIVGATMDYDEFIGKFTDSEYLRKSKHLRQVIFGNVSPKRQRVYEKYLMDSVVTELLAFLDRDDIVSFNTDEVVVDVTDRCDGFGEVELDLMDNIERVVVGKNQEGIPLRIGLFELRYIEGAKGYVKKYKGSTKLEFKAIDALTLPFVLRAYNGECVQVEDMVFRHEGKLAQLLEVPEIEVV